MKRIYGFIVGLAVLGGPDGCHVGSGERRPHHQTDGLSAGDRHGRRTWPGGPRHPVLVGRRRCQRPLARHRSGINTVGFDASGLMQYAYAGAGIKLPRSSGAIYQVGQKILPQQAQKGDMIFYGPNGTESVAMFLGNNQMLEVGDVVQVSPVRSSGMTPYVVRVLGTPQAPSAAGTDAASPGQQAPLAPAQQPPVPAGTGAAGAVAAGSRAGATAGAAAGAGTSRRRHRRPRCRRYRDSRRSSCRRCRRCSCRYSRRPRSRHRHQGPVISTFR